MELSERFIRQFESEGYSNVYEWQDSPGKVYEEHSHEGRVSLFVTDGAIRFDFSGDKKEVNAGQRFDVPVGVPHSAIVGPDGCIMIVGEELQGDS